MFKKSHNSSLPSSPSLKGSDGSWLGSAEVIEGILEDEGVAFFRVWELLFLGAQNGDRGSPAFGLNFPPPESIAGNIRGAVIIAEKLRIETGLPLRVLSAFRSQPYNSSIGGSRQSLHLQFMALDLSPPPGKVKKLHEAAAAFGGIGGLGFYPWGIHVDSRRGRARWGTRVR